MTELEAMSEAMNRLLKIALDTGQADSLEEAERIFAGHRVQIVVGPDAVENPVLQAAALTAVNSAVRAFLGGVTVVGMRGPLRISLPPFATLEDATLAFGASAADCISPDIPTLVFGDPAGGPFELLALRATYSGWSAGVAPFRSRTRLPEVGTFMPAGVMAGGLAISEIFQRVRGDAPIACRRSIGFDLWDLSRAWTRGADAPALDKLPSELWLVGLGNLGQAFLWTLGLLPYKQGEAHFVLQDRDTVAESNLSTSMLTNRTMLGAKKARALAQWCEVRGFQTSIVERDFAPDFKVGAREPTVALVGVDNALARQAIEDVGFGRIIEAGLGRGPQDFLGIDVHTFPGSRTARDVWPEIGANDVDITQPAYRALLERSGDRCGAVRLAGRSIGAPFVGSVAAALAVSEVLRLCMGGPSYEMVSCHLRELPQMTSVLGPVGPLNPGTVAIAA